MELAPQTLTVIKPDLGMLGTVSVPANASACKVSSQPSVTFYFRCVSHVGVITTNKEIIFHYAKELL